MENLWPSRVSLSALLFVLIFYFDTIFGKTFPLLELKIYTFLRGSSKSFVKIFVPCDVSIAVFRNYTEMKMFPSPLRNFGALFGGVGDSSKAERQGERQSTIKRAPLDEGAGGRRVRTHTDRLTNTINHFFSRVARLVQLKRGC